MMQIHNEWRNIMRRAKIEEQREDIDWLSKKHVHQVGLLFFLLNHLTTKLPIAVGNSLLYITFIME